MPASSIRRRFCRLISDAADWSLQPDGHVDRLAALAPGSRVVASARISEATGTWRDRPRVAPGRVPSLRDRTEATLLDVDEGLADLVEGVHHERSVLHDGLAQRLAGQHDDVAALQGGQLELL